MKISAKGKYAIKIMVELAVSDPEKYITTKTIAQKQHISEKYLEQIISALNKSGLVRSTRGSQGGYRLTKSPESYTVGMILRSIEGSLAPVSCLDDKENRCPNSKDCVSLFIWEKIYQAINEVVDTITLQDIVEHQNGTNGENYSI